MMEVSELCFNLFERTGKSWITYQVSFFIFQHSALWYEDKWARFVLTKMRQAFYLNMFKKHFGQKNKMLQEKLWSNQTEHVCRT